MAATLFLKCILLAKTHVDVVVTPINEYAMAEIKKDYNQSHFEANVIEGRLNSISIKLLKSEVETIVYSTRDYDQKGLSAHLNYKSIHSSADCEITEQNTLSN